MDPEELEERAHNASSLEEAAEVLTALLTGSYYVRTDGTLLEKKQRVDRIGKFSVHVRSNEHPPPHFHVIGADVNASFTLDDCTFMKGNLSDAEQKLVKKWFEMSRRVVVDAWNATRPSNCPVGPVED